MKDRAGTDDDPKAYFRKVDIFQHKDRLGDWGIKKFPTFKVFVLGHESSHLEGKDAFYNDLPSAIDAAFFIYDGYDMVNPGGFARDSAVLDCSTVPSKLTGEFQV